MFAFFTATFANFLLVQSVLLTFNRKDEVGIPTV